MRSFAVSALMLMALGLATAQLTQVSLPYKLEQLEPNIDSQTMKFHYGTHYKAYVDNMNAGTKEAGNSNVRAADLTTLVQGVSKFRSQAKGGDDKLFTAIRNQGGGAWNHAMYFKHLAPAKSVNADPSKSVSKELSAAIDSSFGGFDKMKEAVTGNATKVFGSGWSWLCLAGDKLVVTTTPNQDNPLMGDLPGAPKVKNSGCKPILGLDVWEHAYYLKHGPKRADYVKDFWGVVDWAQVSKNFAAAKSGDLKSLVA